MEKIRKKKIFTSKNIGSLGMKDDATFLIFLLPALIFLIVFEYIPIIMGIISSFFTVDIVNLPGKFIGFDNYIRVFQDKEFYATVFQTIKHYLYGLCMAFWPPILTAMFINEVRTKIWKNISRTIFYIPAVAPAVAMLVFWKFFWNPDYGLANQIISVFGAEPKLWLNDENWVYFCMHFQGLVLTGGMNMLIYLAAMQDIPQERYEAALIDGAGVLQRVYYITLPAIKGTVSSLFMLSAIGAFNIMEDILVLTGGGPYGKSRSVLSYAYKQACESTDYAYAITVSTILFATVLVLTIITKKISARKEKK